MDLRIIPKNKKGLGIGDIYPIMLTICLVAVLIAIVLFILQSTQTSLPTTSRHVENATLNITETAKSVEGCHITALEIQYLFQKNGTSLLIGNLTTTSSGTYVITPLGNQTGINGSNVNVTYSVTDSGQACKSMGTISAQIVDFIPWIGIILLIVAAAIVIGVLVNSLGKQSRT